MNRCVPNTVFSRVFSKTRQEMQIVIVTEECLFIEQTLVPTRLGERQWMRFGNNHKITQLCFLFKEINSYNDIKHPSQIKCASFPRTAEPNSHMVQFGKLSLKTKKIKKSKHLRNVKIAQIGQNCYHWFLNRNSIDFDVNHW